MGSIRSEVYVFVFVILPPFPLSEDTLEQERMIIIKSNICFQQENPFSNLFSFFFLLSIPEKRGVYVVSPVEMSKSEFIMAMRGRLYTKLGLEMHAYVWSSSETLG